MRFSATMFPTQPKTKVYKFGYAVDSNNISWKSGGIKNRGDFMRTMDNAVCNEDVNKFNSLFVWLELSTDRGILSLVSNVGTNFFEINIMGQEDNVAMSNPPTVNFKSIKLKSAVIAFPPPGSEEANPWKLCQLLEFYFEKSSPSWG